MSEPRVPDFIGIGALKAGTTWLAANLRRHPRVWQPLIKELRYFDDVHARETRRDAGPGRRSKAATMLKAHTQKRSGRELDTRYVAALGKLLETEVSDDWYRNIFADAPADHVCGEISPDYATLRPVAIAHVAKLVPDAKIILSMRDPVDRSWSHARMLANISGRNGDIETVSQLENIEYLVRCSDYPMMLNKWRNHFASDQILIVTQDEAAEAPLTLLERVCAHLHIPFNADDFADPNAQIGVGREAPMPPDAAEKLKAATRPIYEAMGQEFPDIAAKWMRRHWPD